MLLRFLLGLTLINVFCAATNAQEQTQFYNYSFNGADSQPWQQVVLYNGDALGTYGNGEMLYNQNRKPEAPRESRSTALLAQGPFARGVYHIQVSGYCQDFQGPFGIKGSVSLWVKVGGIWKYIKSASMTSANFKMNFTCELSDDPADIGICAIGGIDGWELSIQDVHVTRFNDVVAAPNAIDAGYNLPIWPLVVSGSGSKNKTVDWRTLPPPIAEIANSPTGKVGESGVAIDDCGRVAFYLLHDGNEAKNQLNFYAADGTTLTVSNPPAGQMAGISAIKNDELQVVRVPQTSNQWYLIYSLWEKTCSQLSPASASYCPARVVYARVEYNIDTKQLTILSKDIDISSGKRYTQGKAVSRFTDHTETKQYLYLMSRGGTTTYTIDRFTIDRAGIGSGFSSNRFNYTFWEASITGSSVELSYDGKLLAVSNRSEDENGSAIKDFILFNTDELNAAPQYISITDDVWIDVNGTRTKVKDSAMPCKEVLRNKLSYIKFSPSGRFLYVVHGGFAGTGAFGTKTHNTYLIQIDLESNTNGGGYDGRFQIQKHAEYSPGTAPCSGNIVSTSPSDHAIGQIQAGYDGRLYFTKRNSPYLFVIPFPDEVMPHNTTPGDVDLSVPGIENINVGGTNHVAYMPETVNGFYYIKKSATEIFTIKDRYVGTGSAMTLVISNYDPAAKYQIAWGDGFTELATGATATHTYTKAGDVSVLVTKTDGGNCSSISTKIVNVKSCEQLLPVMTLSHKKQFCAVRFYSAKLMDCTAVYEWTFGDESPLGTISSRERNPVHIYNAPGTYPVSVKISYNCKGCAGDTTLMDTVEWAGPSDDLDFLDVTVTTDKKLEVINNGATTFSDTWMLDHTAQASDDVNQFLNGSAGVWRNEGVHVYEKDRSQSDNINIKLDGTYTLEQFNWQFADLNAIPNWVKANDITQYSAYSYELENRDVLDVASSAIYDYNGQLPIATAGNAGKDEIAFTDFEIPSPLNPTNTRSAGNWILGRETVSLYTTYNVNIGSANIAIVEATPAQLAGIIEVDVRAVSRFQFLLGPFVPVGYDPGYYKANSIVCVRPHATNPAWSVVIFASSPSDFFWNGSIRIRNMITPTSVGLWDQTVAHTGKASLKVTSSSGYTFKQSILKLQPNKSYIVSAWVSIKNYMMTNPNMSNSGIVITPRRADGTQIGTAFTFTVVAPALVIEGWRQITGSFVCPPETAYVDVTFKRTSVTTYYDDVRLHPSDANMKSYVYDPTDYRLKAVLDEDNYATFFYYDREGNLYLTKKETKDGLKTLSENVSSLIAR